MLSARFIAIFVLLAACTIASSPAAEPEKTGSQTAGKIVKPKTYKARAQTTATNKGRALFGKNKCGTCHTIAGAGGCLAPPLDGVGARRSQKFLETRITSGPVAEGEFARIYGEELMPHVRIAPAEAKLVVQYLLTLPPPKIGFQVIGHNGTVTGTNGVSGETGDSASAASISRGRVLLSSKGCLACHALGDLGGSFAPKFDGIAGRMTREAVRKQMQNAELLTLNNNSEYGPRGTIMPPMNLSAQEIEDLANYLITLK